MPNVLFSITFNDNFDTTYFKIIPYDNEDLSTYTFNLSIDELNIYNEPLNNTNNYTYELTINDNVFETLSDKISITIDVFSGSDKIATYRKEKYKLIYELFDSLILKKFVTSTDTYIVQIPLISKEEYEDEKEKVLNKIKNSLVDSDLSENRLPAVQHSFRFYNTLELYPVENYLKEDIPDNFINLPLKLKLYLQLDKNKIATDGVSIDNFINQLKLDLAKFLTDNYTSSQIEYYVSKVEDFVHNYNYVKFVKVLSPNYNIVVNDYRDYLKTIATDKLEVASFDPVYFWWDVNNIDITYILV